MILVTGGGGFIGSHLVNQLVKAGEAVRVLEGPGADVRHLPIEAVEVVRGDIRCAKDVRVAVQNCRQVYHLAANPNLWTRVRSDFNAVNNEGTRNVLHEALRAGAERVLHTSTESILAGTQNSEQPVEELRLTDENMIGPYCLSKLKGEQEAFRLADSGAPVIVACPTVPIGPGDHNLTPPSRMTLAFCQGKLPAYLDCQLNMIDARDIASGLRSAMNVGQPRIRYLLSGVNMRLVEWLTIVGRLVGREVPRWQVSYPLALIVAYASEWASDHLTGHMPTATITGVKLTRHCMHFKAAASQKYLGLKLRTVEESARDEIAWFRQKGLLN
ncbi:MAG: NAD-dependent epimerase/dehydratase family protein [Verrucomicrobia bacterium]|nr:NAD-dependent epimerase/dehydratase family protein [Verrucomicrobiota bacterium]